MAERKPINYMTESNYNTSTSPGYSTVTLTSDTNVLHFDGVKIVKSPNSVGVGDVLLSSGKWMAGLSIPEGDSLWNDVVGVVINRKGNKVLLHSVKGFNGSDSTNNINSTAPFYNSAAYLVGDSNSYNISKFPNINSNFPANSLLSRKNGRTDCGRAGVNYNQLKSFTKTNNTTDLISNNSIDALRSKFAASDDNGNADIATQQFSGNSELVNRYGYFETYLKDQMLDYPKLSGIFGIAIGKAHEWTKNMAKYKQTGRDADNYATATLDTAPAEVNEAAFPTAYWVNKLSETVTGYNLGAGQWYLIGIEELFEWFNDQYKLNITQEVFRRKNSSNTGLVSSSRWCCARSSNNYAWFYNGNGYFYYGPFYNANRVSAVVLLEL